MKKPIFFNAPNFSLPTSDSIFRLYDMESQNRVALLFSSDEKQCRDALKQVESEIENWRERDLILMIVSSDTALICESKELTFVVHDEHGEVAAQYGVVQGETRFFLLGKSGFLVALCVDYMPDDAEIFALIDAMPMRQRELRERAE